MLVSIRDLLQFNINIENSLLYLGFVVTVNTMISKGEENLIFGEGASTSSVPPFLESGGQVLWIR